MRPNYDKLLKRMRQHKYSSNFILKFYKKYIKLPKLREGELFVAREEESKEAPDLNKIMKNFVEIFLHTSQMLYDLMPLASAISDDPYLDSFKPGRNFVDNYLHMISRAHNDLIRQAQTERIRNHIPYTNSTFRVRIRRVKAIEFAMKNRLETATEHCTVLT